MTQRGSPRHPDLLTSREAQVLDLIREGSTNPQIAEHLDISVETVKQHVSQVLAKLGVTTREEAAAWQPEQEHRWWSTPRAAFALGGSAIVVAALIGLTILAWDALESEDNAALPDGPPLVEPENATVEDVYAALSEYLASQQDVLHMTVEGFYEADFRFDYRVEAWVFPKAEAMRSEGVAETSGDQDGDATEETTRAVITGGLRYVDSDNLPNPVEANMCHGGSVLASEILLCFGPVADSTETFGVEEGEYQDQPSIVLMSSGTSRNDSGDTVGTTRLHLSPSTLLPMARESSGTFDNNEAVFPLSSEITWEYDWVERDSLPADFFEPEAIGYVETVRNPEEGINSLDPSLPVYWLGKQYEAGGGLPLLQLINSYAPSPPSAIPYRLDLTYGNPGVNSTPTLSMQESSPSQLEMVSGTVPCSNRLSEEVAADRIIEIYECSDGPNDKIEAKVLFGDTIVLVSPLFVGDSAEGNPFSTIETMRQIALDLELRE
ncbi:MAG: LuxR C-terminal-related transcriptional regulator [Dehalococcoidia bacterium]